MNTILAVGRIVQGDVHWRVAPLPVSDPVPDVPPYVLGALHAESGTVYNPTIYDKAGDRAEYIDGFQAALFDMDADDINAIFAGPVDGEVSPFALDLVDVDAELDDLIEGRLDNEFWARGM